MIHAGGVPHAAVPFQLGGGVGGSPGLSERVDQEIIKKQPLRISDFWGSDFDDLGTFWETEGGSV